MIVRGDDRTCLSCSGPTQSEASASFDSTTNTWTPLPSDPLSSADNLSSVWTGNALWSFDGAAEVGDSVLPGDTSLYDATTGTWTRLPRAPGACGGEPAWTGHEVLLVCPVVDSNALPGNAAGIAWVAVNKTAALHQTADAYLHAHPKDHDRGLFRYGNDYWVLITDGLPPAPSRSTKWGAGAELFRWDGRAWRVLGEEWGSSINNCFSVGSTELGLGQPTVLRSAMGGPLRSIRPGTSRSGSAESGRHSEPPRACLFALRASQPLLDDQLRPVDARGTCRLAM